MAKDVIQKEKGQRAMKKFGILIGIWLMAAAAGCSSSSGETKVTKDAAESQTASPMEFVKESYLDIYDVYTWNTGAVTIQIHEDVYEPDLAERLGERIRGDYETAAETFPEHVQDTVIHIGEASTFGKNRIVGNRISSTPEEIESGEYEENLVQVLLDLKEPWQREGISHRLFHREEKWDEEELRSFYEQEGSMPVLSLFAAYFSPQFAEEGTRRMAEQTAYSFTEYLLETYGFETVKSCGSSREYRQEWLERTGIPGEYEPLYDLSFLDGASYTFTDQWALVMVRENHTYYIDTIEGSFDTPERIMKGFWQYGENMRYIFAYLKENAPSAREKAVEEWGGSKDFYFSDKVNDYSHSTDEGAYISRLSDWVHETIHVIFPANREHVNVWKDEGLATYLAGICPEIFEGDPLYMILKMNLAEGEYSQEEQSLIDWSREYHNALTEDEEYSAKIYNRAFGLYMSLHPDIDKEQRSYILAMPITQIRSERMGMDFASENTWNYYQAAMVIEYLEETYGLEQFFDFFYSDDFEGTFGMTEEEAMEQAVEEYRLS